MPKTFGDFVVSVDRDGLSNLPEDQAPWYCTVHLHGEQIVNFFSSANCTLESVYETARLLTLVNISELEDDANRIGVE